jgi:hypothetical protein
MNMKVKTPKDGPIHILYTAAKQIVDGTRDVFQKQGQDAREVRLPILMHGTDMRVTIEAGPTIAARNAIEHAQMSASGKPVEDTVNMSKAIDEARALLGLYRADLDAENRKCETGSADWHRTKAYANRCIETGIALKELERLI